MSYRFVKKSNPFKHGTVLLLLTVAVIGIAAIRTMPEKIYENLEIGKDLGELIFDKGTAALYEQMDDVIPNLNPRKKIDDLDVQSRDNSTENLSLWFLENIPGKVKSIKINGSKYIVVTESPEKIIGSDVVVPVESTIIIDENGTVEDVEKPSWSIITIPEKETKNETYVCAKWE